MKFYSAPELTYLSNRAAYKARVLVWVSARNRTTGATETMGLWSGQFDFDFTIGGVTRTYYAAGALLRVQPIVYQAGFDVRVQRLSLSPLSPAVAQLLRGYDARLAPIEIHRALFDTSTDALIAEPRRLFKGKIDSAPIPTPAVGDDVMVDVSMISDAIGLSRTGAQVKSASQQKLRSGDNFRRYNAITGKIKAFWGGGNPFTPPKPRKRDPASGGGLTKWIKTGHV